MRRRTKLVLSITMMVAALASGLSIIYISQILRQLIIEANETANQLTSQLLYVTSNAAPGFCERFAKTASMSRSLLPA